MNAIEPTKALEMEVVSPVDKTLVEYAGKTGLEKPATETLVEAFRPIFVKARTALAEAKGVAESVRDATCVTEIRKSRACRLALRAVRLESDAARKKHKEHALLFGRAVDGFHAILLADLAPVETALQEAEDTAERAEAARKARIKAEREAELRPLMETPIVGDLSELSEADYARTLSDAKLLKQAKIEAAAKAESDRKAKEEAERAERERIAAENARLKAEAEEKERLAEIDRKRIESERAEERRKAKEEADRLEELRAEEQRKAKAERDRIESERIAERKKAEAEAARQAEIARKERERIEWERAEERRKAEEQAARIAEEGRKEREAIESKAKAEREKAAKEAAKLKAELAEKKKAEDAEKARVESERVERDRLAREAAAAPDKAKIEAFAATIKSLQLPTLENKFVEVEIGELMEQYARRIKALTGKL